MLTRPQPHEAEATTHEAEAEATAHEAEATTHEAEAEAKTHLEILIIIIPLLSTSCCLQISLCGPFIGRFINS